MDTDKVLDDIRALAEHLLFGRAVGDNLEEDFMDLQMFAEDLSEKVLQLDEWLKEGGSLPGDWEK